MQYHGVVEGVFLKRPNRFVALVELAGQEEPEIVHVKNTGRCGEILLPGARVFLEPSRNQTRKTRYSLIAAYKGSRLINIDSQAPNQVVAEAIQGGKFPELGRIGTCKREAQFGSSRFDFYFETPTARGFLEVKGVTLEQEGVVSFPDAPTLRGWKHLHELQEAVRQGYRGIVLFLVQLPGVSYFQPNGERDPEFARELLRASAAGVEVWAYDTVVTAETLCLGEKVAVRL